MTELEKMNIGLPFNQTDKTILYKMVRAYILTRKLNRTSMLNQPKRNRLIRKLFGTVDGKPYYVQSPIHVDYGFNVHIGKNFLSNYNLILQDEGQIIFGDNVMIAPNVIITTNLHSLFSDQRIVCYVQNRFPSGHRGNYVYAKPITIGDNVWVCAGAIICPGVSIGNNSVIGAGSVVTKDIPANVLAFGTPCRTIRKITKDDKLNQFINV